MRAAAITPRALESRGPVFLSLLLLIAAVFFCGSAALAQAQSSQTDVERGQKSFTLKRVVDMVRLPVSVVDKKGNFVPGLKVRNFRVFENGVRQQIDAFSSEDIPIAVGLVIDNSGSMKSKRPRVNAAAMMFVHTSNPQDQVFVVNFNDEYYLDMDTDFTNNPTVLKAAIDRIDSRGGTALYDAILGSIHHLRKASREKHVLLVITDGEDHDSSHSLLYTVQSAQHSNTAIYAVGLFTKDDDSREEIRHGKRALEILTKDTGGEAFFPKTIDQVDSVCERIAQDIRDQYMIGYYSTDARKDGTYRTVKVELTGVKHHGKLIIRAKPGYYAPTAQATSSAAAR